MVEKAYQASREFLAFSQEQVDAIVAAMAQAAARSSKELAEEAVAETGYGVAENVIQCMKHATFPGTQELMKHKRTGVILATGGSGMVRAAYSSGKPAFGVGPGNVPALIEKTADLKKAVADVVRGTTFDNGT